MRVCIVGASGKLGQYMVQHALDRGYEVVGVCREQSVEKLDAFKGRITVIPGATNDREVIKRAVSGCDGVLVVLIPRYNYLGPAIAFVCAEVLTVGMWIYRMDKIGYPAHLANVLWRPLAAGTTMSIVLYLFIDASPILQVAGAALSVLCYGAALFALRTFSSEEISQAREGISFVSPFVASWAKRLRRDS